jgi:hypothetical protein
MGATTVRFERGAAAAQAPAMTLNVSRIGEMRFVRR